MIKHLTLLLLIGFVFWSCEDEVEEIELIYSSINNGETLDSYSGILLKFSREISNNEFDALSIKNYPLISLPDSIAIDSSLLPDYKSDYDFVDSSNFIKLNNEPLSFIYDSKNKYCLLIQFTSAQYPAGSYQGFIPNIGDNILMINGDTITFSFNPNFSSRVVPNPFQEGSGLGLSQMRVLFSNLSSSTNIIDIYKVENSHLIKRLIGGWQDVGNVWWDLRDFSNEEVVSGFYAYKLGTDTTNNGFSDYFNEGYFSIIKSDD